MYIEGNCVRFAASAVSLYAYRRVRGNFHRCRGHGALNVEALESVLDVLDEAVGTKWPSGRGASTYFMAAAAGAAAS